MISCSCEKKYIGETGATIKTRINQHKRAVYEKRRNESAIADMNMNCTGNILWEETKTLCKESNYFRRTIRETLEIQKEETYPGSLNGLNKDKGNYVETNSWKPLLKHLSKKTTHCN